MIEDARAVLFLAMFAVLAWFDFKDREIRGIVFVVFGGIGAALYVFDWQTIDQTALYVIAGTIVAVTVLWKAGVVGIGDLFAIFAALAIYPVYHGIIPTVLPVFMGGLVLSLVFTIAWNASLNMSDVIRRGGVFCEIADGRMRKMAAFFLVHRQRKFEKNTFLAEETVGGKRRLKLGMKETEQAFNSPGTTKYVEYACPLMLFTAASAFILVLAGSHILNFVT